MTVTIETQTLTRLFGDFVAVDKLNLSINDDAFTGILLQQFSRGPGAMLDSIIKERFFMEFMI
jgi:ABC-type branched-subunit amino acid transport system ATPase component